MTEPHMHTPEHDDPPPRQRPWSLLPLMNEPTPRRVEEQHLSEMRRLFERTLEALRK